MNRHVVTLRVLEMGRGISGQIAYDRMRFGHMASSMLAGPKDVDCKNLIVHSLLGAASEPIT